MSFKYKYHNAATGPLYHEKKIIKFFENLNRDLPSPGYFIYMANIHNHNTRIALKKLVNVPYTKTSFYKTHSITAKSVKDWNNLQNKVVFEFHQEQVSIPKLISTLKGFCTSYRLDRNSKGGGICYMLGKTFLQT